MPIISLRVEVSLPCLSHVFPSTAGLEGAAGLPQASPSSESTSGGPGAWTPTTHHDTRASATGSAGIGIAAPSSSPAHHRPTPSPPGPGSPAAPLSLQVARASSARASDSPRIVSTASGPFVASPSVPGRGATSGELGRVRAVWTARAPGLASAPGPVPPVPSPDALAGAQLELAPLVAPVELEGGQVVSRGPSISESSESPAAAAISVMVQLEPSDHDAAARGTGSLGRVDRILRMQQSARGSSGGASGGGGVL